MKKSIALLLAAIMVVMCIFTLAVCQNGVDGADGNDGENGKSAFEIFLKSIIPIT